MPHVDIDDRDLGVVVDLHDRFGGARLPIGDDREIRLLLGQLLGAGHRLLGFELLVAIDDLDAEIFRDLVDALVDRYGKRDRRPALREGEGERLGRLPQIGGVAPSTLRQGPSHMLRSPCRKSTGCVHSAAGRPGCHPRAAAVKSSLARAAASKRNTCGQQHEPPVAICECPSLTPCRLVSAHETAAAEKTFRETFAQRKHAIGTFSAVNRAWTAPASARKRSKEYRARRNLRAAPARDGSASGMWPSALASADLDGFESLFRSRRGHAGDARPGLERRLGTRLPA